MSDPRLLADLFQRDRETHLYGLADLEDPYWSASAWYLHGDAAVGQVSVGGDWVTGYAMSRTAPLNTLRLLGETHSSLPQGSWVTGPVGLAEFMQMRRRIETKGAHWRMILDDPGSLEAFEEVVDLDVSALGALADLHASDPSGAFWMPEMLEINPFVGIWDDDLLVASAGTHVISERFGVAAVGAVITRPSHRGRGLAGRVVSTLCSRLWARFETIGLNVEVANPAALNVYDRLGFRRAFRYEEVELG